MGSLKKLRKTLGIPLNDLEVPINEALRLMEHPKPDLDRIAKELNEAKARLDKLRMIIGTGGDSENHSA